MAGLNSKMYRAGVVGSGFIGEAHIEALRRLGNVNVVALCDVHQPGEKAGALFIPQAYEDYREMLDQAELDVVHICAPNHLHYPIAKYALEKGVHIVCEKPFTLTLEEAEALTKLVAEAGVMNMVNFHNRFYPLTHHLRQMVRQGELGDLITVHGGYIQDWLLLETDYSWRMHSKIGGKTRAVGDIGSHWLDLVEYVSGHRIAAVMAQTRKYYGTRKLYEEELGQYKDVGIDTEDCACILFRLDNGAIGTATISQMFAGRRNQLTLQMAGTKQSASWDSEEPNNLFLGLRTEASHCLPKDPNLVSEATKSLVDYPGGHSEGFPDAFKQAFRSFYQALEHPGGERPFATFADGLRSMRLCEGIWESAQAGSWVSMPPAENL